MKRVKAPGELPLDRFVARDNVNRFRDQLRFETEPTKRSMLQKLLVEEEDRLAADFALLEDVAREIANCQQRIDRQRALVETLERCGRDAAIAKALLSAITESLILHQDYRQRVAARLDQNRLLSSIPQRLTQVEAPGSTGRV